MRLPDHVLTLAHLMGCTHIRTSTFIPPTRWLGVVEKGDTFVSYVTVCRANVMRVVNRWEMKASHMQERGLLRTIEGMS